MKMRTEASWIRRIPSSIALAILGAACTSAPHISTLMTDIKNDPKSDQSRTPAQAIESGAMIDLKEKKWRLQDATLDFKNLKGKCEFSKLARSAVVHMTSTSNEISGLIVRKLLDEENGGCSFSWYVVRQEGKIGAEVADRLASSPLLPGFFAFQVVSPTEVEFQFAAGDLFEARSEFHFQEHDRRGYVSLFTRLSEMRTIAYMMKKLPEDEPTKVRATCSDPVLVGVIGMRKQVVTCLLPDRKGAIRLIEHSH